MAASRGRLVDDSGRSSRRQCLAVHRSVWCVSRCCSGGFFLVVYSYTFDCATLRGFFAAARPGIREYNGAGTVSGAHRDYGIKMRLRIHWILLSTAVVILAGCNAATEKEQTDTKQRTSASSTYNTFPDDLYLDDQDALEGSGRGVSDNRDDLEASGSGLGPDDEDGDDDREFNGNNGLEIPSKPTEARPPYFIDETNAKTKQQTTIDAVNRPANEVDVIEPSGTEDDHADNTDEIHEVYIMNPKHEDRASSFFAQPGVLAAVIGGAVVGLLCAILVVMFIVYRMRKKDEGSYALDEPRRSPAAQAFPKPGAPHHNREFYA